MPRFICAKLFRFFIADEPEPHKSLLDLPAQVFQQNRFQVAPVLRLMLASNLFHSSRVRGRKIRSPVELVIGTLRGLEATANSEIIAKGLRSIGQGLFYPPNVKGWDGGRSWINSSTLLGRSNLFRQILMDEDTRFAGGSLLDHLKNQGCEGVPAVLDHFETVLMATPIPVSVRAQLEDEFASSGGDQNRRFLNLLHAVTSLPQYQLG